MRLADYCQVLDTLPILDELTSSRQVFPAACSNAVRSVTNIVVFSLRMLSPHGRNAKFCCMFALIRLDVGAHRQCSSDGDWTLCWRRGGEFSHVADSRVFASRIRRACAVLSCVDCSGVYAFGCRRYDLPTGLFLICVIDIYFHYGFLLLNLHVRAFCTLSWLNK